MMKVRKGASAIPYNSERDEFLLVKRAESKKEHPDLWEFPGGNVDKGETPREAALRELEEETNLKGRVIRTGESGTVEYPHGLYEIYPFLVLVDTDDVDLSPEHTDYRWASIDEISNHKIVAGLERELKALDLVDDPTDVAVAVVRNRDSGRYLLMHRVKELRVFPEKWDFPSGSIEDESARQASLRELKEETGLEGEIQREGEPFLLETRHGDFQVHPFLVEADSEEIEMNWEHDEYRWMELGEIDEFETVEGLKRDLEVLDVL